MAMTKNEAEAILALSEELQVLVAECVAKLSGDAKTYAENYWAAHIRNIAQGSGYGSMPVFKADAVLNDDEE